VKTGLVVTAAPGDIAGQIAAAGLAFPALPGSSDRPAHGAALVEQLRNWYRRAAIDVVAFDPIYYAASLAREPAGLPWAGVLRFRRRATATWFARWGTL